MTDQPTDRLMTAFYAAVSAIEDGKVGEVEIEERIDTADGAEITLRLVARLEVAPIAVGDD